MHLVFLFPVHLEGNAVFSSRPGAFIVPSSDDRFVKFENIVDAQWDERLLINTTIENTKSKIKQVLNAAGTLRRAIAAHPEILLLLDEETKQRYYKPAVKRVPTIAKKIPDHSLSELTIQLATNKLLGDNL